MAAGLTHVPAGCPGITLAPPGSWPHLPAALPQTYHLQLPTLSSGLLPAVVLESEVSLLMQQEALRGLEGSGWEEGMGAQAPWGACPQQRAERDYSSG